MSKITPDHCRELLVLAAKIVEREEGALTATSIMSLISTTLFMAAEHVVLSGAPAERVIAAMQIDADTNIAGLAKLFNLAQ